MCVFGCDVNCVMGACRSVRDLIGSCILVCPSFEETGRKVMSPSENDQTETIVVIGVQVWQGLE